MFTYDINLFKNVKGNRLISNRHVEHLMESIEKKNKLEGNPIKITPSFEVTDGQHRIEALKRLISANPDKKYPIHYWIDEEGRADDIIMYNANQKAWTMADFSHYFSEVKQTPSYSFLKKMMFLYKVPFGILYTILCTVHKGGRSDFSKRFKRGNFILDALQMHDLEKYIQITKQQSESYLTQLRMDRKDLRSRKFWVKSWQLSFHKIYTQLGEKKYNDMWNILNSKVSKWEDKSSPADVLIFLASMCRGNSDMKKDIQGLMK